MNGVLELNNNIGAKAMFYKKQPASLFIGKGNDIINLIF